MAIAMTADCLLCHFKRHLTKAQKLGDQETAMAFGRALMKLYLNAPQGISSPWFSPQVAELFKKFYNLGDNQYEEEKRQANAFAMARLDQMRDMIRSASDPVLAGLRMAILGNYLDFSALQGQVSFDKLEEMIRQAMDMELDMDVYAALRKDLAAGKRLLYLTDNAGEIAMDRLFAEEIQRNYPELEITFCVRGGLTINDATREDAEIVGIPFRVIDNGNLVSGTELTMLSKEAKEAMDSADVIISKGMANTETLYGCGYPIYYAFLVKCVHFEQVFQKPLMTPMLIKDPGVQ
jgi:uncharacterized protein with ATP-grasp and redox domains